MHCNVRGTLTLLGLGIISYNQSLSHDTAPFESAFFSQSHLLHREITSHTKSMLCPAETVLI
jgi:hypothetical protein